MSIKTKISFITSTDENTGSTRLRVYKIAQNLQTRGYDVNINSNFDDADILVFQKSDIAYLEAYFKKYKYSNKLLIFDIDDLYRGNYLRLIRMSDLVIVSSNYLKEQYKKYNKNIVVLENSIDVKNQNCKLKEYNLRDPKIGWFGNCTNLKALQETKVQNVTTITQNGDIKWELDTIDDELQKFDLILCPQLKTPEGLSKSNCRMLKALYLGIPVLATDLPSYVDLAKHIDYPENFILKDGESWLKRVEDIRNGKIKFDFDFEQCRNKINMLQSCDIITNKWLEYVTPNFKKRSLLTLIRYLKLLMSFFQKIVSFKNEYNKNKKHKVLTIFGIKVKFNSTPKDK